MILCAPVRCCKQYREKYKQYRDKYKQYREKYNSSNQSVCSLNRANVLGKKLKDGKYGRTHDVEMTVRVCFVHQHRPSLLHHTFKQIRHVNNAMVRHPLKIHQMFQQPNDVFSFPRRSMVTGKTFRVQRFVDFDQDRGSGFEGQQTAARWFVVFRLFRRVFIGGSNPVPGPVAMGGRGCFESFGYIGSKWQSAGGGGRGGGSGSGGCSGP